MNRIIASCIVIVGSVMLYVGLRYLKEYKASVALQNVVMFAPTAILFGIYTYISGAVIGIDFMGLGYIFIAAFFFSWLGNRFSLISLQYAPNPGYSLMISKSYVILTAILAVFFFHSPLTYLDAIAIILVVLFSCMLLYEKSTIQKSQSKIWIIYAVLAFLCRAFLALANKRLLQMGYNASVINFWIFAFVSVITLLEILLKKENNIIKTLPFKPVLAIIIGMFLFNRGLMEGYKLAPNPGYISAANASSIAFLTGVSVLLFGDTLSRKKAIAIIGIIIGVSLLFLF